MFFGRYAYSLDNKGRLVLPAKFRQELGDVVFAMRGYEKCLSIYPAHSFEKLVQHIDQLSFHQKNARDFIRASLASTIEMPLDSHGRIQIPSQTLAAYQFDKQLIVIGVNDHLEIWTPQAYEAYEREVNENYEAIAEGLDGK